MLRALEALEAPWIHGHVLSPWAGNGPTHRVKTLGFQPDLVARAVGEAQDLGLERGAVARSADVRNYVPREVDIVPDHLSKRRWRACTWGVSTSYESVGQSDSQFVGETATGVS